MATVFDLRTGLNTVIKRPAEGLTIPFDFGLKLNGDQLEDNATVVITSKNLVPLSGELVLDNFFLADDNRYIVTQIYGGTDQEDYEVVVTCTDTVNNTYQIAGIIKVRANV